MRKGPLKRSPLPRRDQRLVRRTPLSRSLDPKASASDAQRAKVAGRACLVCGRTVVDPAHLVSRALGGCDDADCVVALCRPHHRAFDTGRLDLLPYLEPASRVELAHAVGHLGLIGTLRRVTGRRYAGLPVAGAGNRSASG